VRQPSTGPRSLDDSDARDPPTVVEHPSEFQTQVLHHSRHVTSPPPPLEAAALTNDAVHAGSADRRSPYQHMMGGGESHPVTCANCLYYPFKLYFGVHDRASGTHRRWLLTTSSHTSTLNQSIVLPLLFVCASLRSLSVLGTQNTVFRNVDVCDQCNCPGDALYM
jgi:hypothetical protein